MRSDSDTCPPWVEIDPLDEIRQKVKHELIAFSSEEETRIADALEMELLGGVCFGSETDIPPRHRKVLFAPLADLADQAA